MIKERLKQYLQFKRLSMGEFSRMVGVQTSNMSRISSNVSQRTLRKIEANTDLNVDWLMTGKGDMINTSCSTTPTLSINETKGDQSPIVNGNENEVKVKNESSANRSIADLKKELDSVKKSLDTLEGQLATKDAQIAEKDKQISEKDTQIRQLFELLSKK